MSQMRVDARPVQELRADVLVVGGGASGLAVAVTAARQNLSVILIERYGFCGGGAVAGLSGTVCGLFAASEGTSVRPCQMVHGFVDEFLAVMRAKNGLSAPVRYGKTFTLVHNPIIWREAADHLLQAAGVKVLLHTLVTSVFMDGDRVVGVEASTKQGRLIIMGAVVVDASGDADVCAMAGLDTFMGDQGRVQNPTMLFRLQGVDVPRFLGVYGEDSILGYEIADLIEHVSDTGEFSLPRRKIFLFPTPNPHELLCNCTRIVGDDGRDLNPVLLEDMSAAERLGRLQARQYADFFRKYLAGCEQSFLVDTGVQVGVRQSRQINGLACLAGQDVVRAVKRPDGIARSPWPIELHSGKAPKLVWIIDDYYEIPYGCFVPNRGEGLLVAGRCLSAEHEAMASARVTAQCFSYGQAIGHAAALCVKEDIAPRAVDGRDLRLLLNRDGALLD